jgi:hypothetical protein
MEHSSSLASVAKQLNEEFFTTELEVGKIVKHPEHGRVKITDGQFWGIHGLSNFWSWRKVDKENKPYGKTYNGYGWA